MWINITMTRSQSVAYRLRWVILVTGLLCVIAGIWWLALAPYPTALKPTGGEWDGLSMGLWGTPAYFEEIDLDSDALSDNSYWASFAIFIGLFFTTQWLFLFPRGRLRIGMADHGWPMVVSVISAAFAAMLLTTAASLTLVETLVLIRGGNTTTLDLISRLFGDEASNALYGLWAAMAIVWSGWAFAFYHYWHAADRYTWLSRIVRGLLGGSILEMLAAVPVQALHPQRKECYCSLGSYTGLVFGGTVALWCFGPGIVLLFLRERYRRASVVEDQPTV